MTVVKCLNEINASNIVIEIIQFLQSLYVTFTFVCIICIICDRTKNNDSIKTYCDAVALTDNFVFVRWLVGAKEQVRILILTIKFDPKDTKKLPCLFPTN